MGPRPGHPDRRPRRFDLAEDATQEAFAMAADRWPRDGVPSNPRAWLMRTARNRATNRIGRDRALATKFGLLVAGNSAEVPMRTTTFPDERLELIFTCCHPALAVEAQVALTLRTLGGLSTDEIARAFLVPERTMAQRLVRAKQDQSCGDPVSRATGSPAPRASRRRSRRRLPDLQ